MIKRGSEPKLNVLVFGASLRAGSLNHQLAALAAAQMRDFDVPSYDGDVEKERGIPKGAEELRRRLLESDAFIVSSPEYNASMPGMLKNLIDWTSRYRPQPFDGKHGLLLSASPCSPVLPPTALGSFASFTVRGRPPLGADPRRAVPHRGAHLVEVEGSGVQSEPIASEAAAASV